MSTTVSESGSPPSGAVPTSRLDTSVLEDRMPGWFRTPRVLTAFAGLVSVVFLAANYLPLAQTDLWGHLAYGRAMWQQGGFASPPTASLLPLAEGMPVTDTAWLSQWIGYGAFRGLGLAGLHLLYGGSIATCVGLFCWMAWRRTGDFWISTGGAALLLWLEWKQLVLYDGLSAIVSVFASRYAGQPDPFSPTNWAGLIRPQLAGLVCFFALLCLVTARRWRRWHWIAIPALFVLWANLHGSFPVGLIVMACLLAGRVIDLGRRRQLARFAFDRTVQRYFVLLELSAAAALLNPYGLALYAEVLSFGSNPNVSVLADWQPLTLRMVQGQAAAFGAVLLVMLYRLTPRRVFAGEVLLLVVLGAGALWSSRLLVWWAPLAAYFAVVHGNAVVRGRAEQRSAIPSPRASSWTVATVGLVWIALALTPAYRSVVSGGQPLPRSSLASDTPLAATAYLRENPSSGLIFNTFEWGDYLAWAGPPGTQVFAGSHVHELPQEVWLHYLGVLEMTSGWHTVLNRYGVNSIVLDPARHRDLVEELRGRDEWQVAFEQSDNVEQSIIFTRRNPI